MEVWVAPQAFEELKIGIYAGKGSSHSWLWFLKLLERAWPKIPHVQILDESNVKEVHKMDFAILLVSGGDTFELARGLGEDGARAVEAFVNQGGIYWGSCAGAYLILNSSKTPLNLFNFVKAKITNIGEPLIAAPLDEKYKTPYGCKYVVHPVREEVLLTILGREYPYYEKTIPAPIYGGPIISNASEGNAMALYSGFTSKTKFLLPESAARKMVLGGIALLMQPFGKGTFFVSGPHMEHPKYIEANKLLLRLLGLDGVICFDLKKRHIGHRKFYGIKELNHLKSVLSNLLIRARAMAMVDCRWRIGAKIYETEKILVFLEPLWERILLLERFNPVIEKDKILYLLELGSELIGHFKDLQEKIDSGEVSELSAVKVFNLLREFSKCFLNIYYQKLRAFISESG